MNIMTPNYILFSFESLDIVKIKRFFLMGSLSINSTDEML